MLNGWHLSLSWRESRAWDRRAARHPLPPELRAELQAELLASWERVFEFDLLRRARMWGPIDRIQGVTEYVRLDEVRRVDEFVAR